MNISAELRANCSPALLFISPVPRRTIAAVTPLDTVAEQEWESLVRRLDRIWDRAHPVSVHLYQPITGTHYKEGRLVDVGPRPREAASGLCWQPASAGAT